MKKSYTVACRLGEEAYEKFNSLRRSSGLNTRQLFEKVFLENEIQVVVRKPKASKDYLALLSQVHRAGNNLNQIARKLNQARGTINETDLQESFVLLQNIEQMLITAL